jgi:meso-butanediol dehydrogenase/(S,S)-butanediol dehydrogenase/diacetyl reductase
MRFRNHRIIVTGGASGIGRATVEQFIAEGATVAILDLDQQKGRNVAEEITAQAGKDRVRFFSVDVSDGTSVDTVIRQVEEDMGPVSVLVNNAGIALFGTIMQITVAQWRRTLDVVLDSVFHCCRAVIPLMRKRGGGTIVNTASIAGMAVEYNLAAYDAAKGGVIALTRALAIDHIRENIRVNCVCPGLVVTPGTAFFRERHPEYWHRLEEDYPRGRASTPEEIAKVIAFLASSDSEALVGSAVVADGGLTAWSGQANLARFRESEAARL